MRSRIIRTKGSLDSFVADSLPSIAAQPSSADVGNLAVADFTASGNIGARGFALFPVFLDGGAAEVTGPTVTFTLYQQDDNDDGWVPVATVTTLAHRTLSTFIPNPSGGKCYARVTAVASLGAAVSVQIRAIPVAEGA